MRALWDLLEGADRLVLRTLDRVDRLRKLEPLFERTKRATEQVRPPQRVIEFDA